MTVGSATFVVAIAFETSRALLSVNDLNRHKGKFINGHTPALLGSNQSF